MAPAVADSPSERLERRDFPSVFQAWSAAEVPGESELDSVARHDLLFHTLEWYGLQWAEPGFDTPAEFPGEATEFVSTSIETARQRRSELLERNPDMVMLAELRYRDGPPGFLPTSDAWWLRDSDGERVLGWPEGGSYRMDIGNDRFIAHVIERARALMETGVVDGVMLDVWNEFEDPFQADRLALIQGVRTAVGDGIIVVNTNDIKAPTTGEYVNGLYMENSIQTDAATWANYRELMTWADGALRRPSFTAFETWRGNVLDGPVDASRQDADDRRRMRATTALSLVASDGFTLFADPNWLTLSDHLHDWYDFWDADLGRPTGPAVDLVGGAVRRDYENGVAVYSPPGGTTGTITFDRPVTPVSRDTDSALSHPIRPFDGEIFLFDGDASAPGGTVGDATIDRFDPPVRVAAGETVSLDVAYATDAPVDLVVSFQDTTDDWRTYGFARVELAANSASKTVTVPISPDAPASAGYAWTAWLAPRGGTWESRIEVDSLDGIVVAPYADDIAAIDAPTIVRAGESFEVTVVYESTENRSLHLTFQDTANGWTTVAYDRIDVTRGSGRVTVPLTVAADAATGARYALGAYLTAPDKDWDDRVAVGRVDGRRVQR